MLSLVKLYLISWLRSFVGPLFAVAFPFLMLILLGQFIPFRLLAPGYIVYAAVTLGIQSLSISLVQFKSSSLIKRIGQTPITRTQFIASLLIFYLILIVLSSAFVVMSMWFLQEVRLVQIEKVVQIPGFVDGTFKLKEKTLDYAINFDKIQWPIVFLATSVSALFSISTGLIISSAVKTTEQANGVGLLVYFVLNFLTGIFFPLSIIKNSATLDRISVFMPLRIMTESLTKAFNGDFSFSGNYLMTVETASDYATKSMVLGQIWQWWIYPIVFSLILLVLSVILFKWE